MTPWHRQQPFSRRPARAYDLPPVPVLIAFLHATAGYLVKQTWVEAIKRGAYRSWPGLTPQLVARYCPDVDETHLGHMAQPRQHTRSTQRCLARDMDATAQTANTVEVIKLPLNRMFTNNTGHFQPRSQWESISHGGIPCQVQCHTRSTVCNKTRWTPHTSVQHPLRPTAREQ